MKQFNHDALVYTADGQEAGHIDRVVLDPLSKKVSHIVIRRGLLFTEDKVVPIEMIADASSTRVTLRPNIGDPDDLPEFEEEYYIAVDGEEVPTHYAPGHAQMVYWYPFGREPIDHPDYDRMKNQPVRLVTERNIPQDAVALKEGATVTGADGTHIGTIERVFLDQDTNQATTFLVSNGMLLKEKLLIPTAWVTAFGEREVRLAVGSRTLEKQSRLIETLSKVRQKSTM